MIAHSRSLLGGEDVPTAEGIDMRCVARRWEIESMIAWYFLLHRLLSQSSQRKLANLAWVNGCKFRCKFLSDGLGSRFTAILAFLAFCAHFWPPHTKR